MEGFAGPKTLAFFDRSINLFGAGILPGDLTFYMRGRHAKQDEASAHCVFILFRWSSGRGMI